MEVPKRLVLDTTALVNHLRQKQTPSTVTKLQGLAELATTQINLFELYLGAYKAKDARFSLASVKGFVSTITMLPLTDSAAESAGRILAELDRTGHRVEIRDLFIATIALEQGYAVLTENREHFKRIPGLGVVTERELLEKLDKNDKAKGSRFGLTKRIGPFTVEDEMKAHDN